jgi:hypothetical protein
MASKKYLIILPIVVVILLSSIIIVPYSAGTTGNQYSISHSGSQPIYMNITSITLTDSVITPELNGTYHITATGANFSSLSLIHIKASEGKINITATSGNLTELNIWSKTLGFSVIDTTVDGILNVITTITGVISGNITIKDVTLEPTYFHADYQDLSNSNINMDNL